MNSKQSQITKSDRGVEALEDRVRRNFESNVHVCKGLFESDHKEETFNQVYPGLDHLDRPMSGRAFGEDTV